MHLAFVIGGWCLMALGVWSWGWGCWRLGVAVGKRLGHREAAIVIGKLALPAAFRSGWEIGHRGEMLPDWTVSEPPEAN